MTGVAPSGAINRNSLRLSHGLFFDQTRLDPHLAKHEADEAGMGAKWVMVKRDHQTRA